MKKNPKAYLRIYVLIIIGFFLLLSFIEIQKNIYYPRYDSGGYITAALSLAQNYSYQDISVPKMIPSAGWRWPAEFYKRFGYDDINPDYPLFRLSPPVLPLILAPVIKIFGKNFQMMQLIICFLGLLCLIGTWFCFKKLEKKEYFLGIVSLLLFSLFYNYSLRIQTEIPYLCFSLFALYFLGNYFQSKSLWNKDLVALLLLVNLCIYTRLIGITFFFTIVLLCLLHFRKNLKKSLLLLILSIFLIALPFYIYVEYITTPGTFTSQSSLLRKDGWYETKGYNKLVSPATLGRITLHSGAIVMHGSRVLFGPKYRTQGSIFFIPLIILLIMIFLLGFISSLPSMIRPSHNMCHLLWYFFIYIAFYSLLPWPADRFVIPILPIYLYFLLIGMEIIISVLVKKSRSSDTLKLRSRLLGIIIFSIMVVNSLRIITDTHEKDLWATRGNPSYRVSKWIKENTSADDILLVLDNFANFVYTGRKCFSYTLGEWKNVNTKKYINAGGRLDYLVYSDMSENDAHIFRSLTQHQKTLVPLLISDKLKAFKINNEIKP